MEAPVTNGTVRGTHRHFGGFDEGVLIAANLVVSGDVCGSITLSKADSNISHKVDTGSTGRHSSFKELTSLALKTVVDKLLLGANQGCFSPAKVNAFTGEAHKIQGLYVVSGVFISAHHAGFCREVYLFTGKGKAKAHRHLGLIQAKFLYKACRNALIAGNHGFRFLHAGRKAENRKNGKYV